MDDVDLTNDRLEKELDLAIKASKKKTPKHTGYCLYCNAEVKERAFCSAECREDYEQEERIKKIMGRF